MSSIAISKLYKTYKNKQCCDCGKRIWNVSKRCSKCYWKNSVQDPRERFFKYVEKTNTCWNWTGARHKFGYGHFAMYGRQGTTHRFSWEFHYGKIPKGKFVLHTCDNPPCVNPKHLWLGTTQENTADKTMKGRQIRGEDVPVSKLKWNQVDEIRKLYETGKYTQRQLAKMYGVTQCPIARIVRNTGWKR